MQLEEKMEIKIGDDWASFIEWKSCIENLYNNYYNWKWSKTESHTIIDLKNAYYLVQEQK